MKILLDNVNLGSSSGPNSFGRQLTLALKAADHDVINAIELMNGRATLRGDDEPIGVQLAFIEALTRGVNVPLVQRLDGIYYNVDERYGDWHLQNRNISATYDAARGIIFQSPFSKRLVEAFFGKRDVPTVVINNGVSTHVIDGIPKNVSLDLEQYDTVWMSASSWRPHKRLGENIRYFQEHSSDRDVMLIAGDLPRVSLLTLPDRVIALGELNWYDLIGIYKRVDNFVHLAYHDNCPNVIVDARSAGCNIVCASCSGSPSIAGPNAIVVDEDDWEPEPIELYKPPKLDFTRARVNGIESNINIVDVADRYVEFLREVIEVQ